MNVLLTTELSFRRQVAILKIIFALVSKEQLRLAQHQHDKPAPYATTVWQSHSNTYHHAVSSS